MADASQSVAVAWDDLLAAFEFADFNGGGLNQAYVCMKTGALYTISDYGNFPGEPPEDLETSDQYVEIPNRNDLSLGTRLVFDFVRQKLPEAWDDVSDIFRRKGAYGRYKAFLRRRGALDRWHAFENAATERALREWAAEAGVHVIDRQRGAPG